MAIQPLIAVTLFGGAGARLWPVLRETLPKPFIKLHVESSAAGSRSGAGTSGCEQGVDCYEMSVRTISSAWMTCMAGHQARSNPGMICYC